MRFTKPAGATPGCASTAENGIRGLCGRALTLPAVEQRCCASGQGMAWLFLVLLSLSGRLYCQSGTAVPSSERQIRECAACDSLLVQSPLAQSRPQPQDQKNSPKEQQNSKERRKGAENRNSPGHIFWVVPAFKVEYGKEFQPLSTKEKFQEWARGAYDPLGLGAGAVEAATLEHSSKDGFCGYGGGWSGYGKCFGSLELDATVSSFLGDFALTSLLHQDPRYFRLGRGSFGRRVWYSISRVFITFNDTGRPAFYTSAISGTVIGAGISNLYAPQQDRGFGHTLSRIGIDLGNTALYNSAAEFWPDIRKVLHRNKRKQEQ